MFGVSWTTVTNNSEEGFSYLVLGFLLDSLWILVRALSAQMRKCHLNCPCIFIHRIVHVLSILGRQPIACFLITVSGIFTAILLSFCTYLPPSSHFSRFPHWVTCHLWHSPSHPNLTHHFISEEMKALRDSLQADSIASIDGELEQISSESNPNSHQA